MKSVRFWHEFRDHDPARVSKLYTLEPNPGMLRLAERQRRRTELDVEVLYLLGERIPQNGPLQRTRENVLEATGTGAKAPTAEREMVGV